MKDVEDIYQLSPGQEAVLASGQLGQVSCALAGVLDVPALEWAWQQVLKRHSILRTSFVWKRLDKPLQVVKRELTIALQIHESVSEADLNQLQREELAKEIDPSVAPLARVVLCRIGKDLSHLILTYHALILDERSVSLLLHEVLAYYASAGNGRSPQLASGSPFWSYVSWVKQQDLAGAESFWRESLRDFNGQTSLAEIYARGDQASAEIGYDQVVTELSTDTFAALEALADRLQIDLETLMHGAWALLLQRESGDEDLVYGYVQSPANLTNNVLGPVSLTMPVRVRIDPYMPAGSWIRSLENQLDEIRRHAFWYPTELPRLQSVVTDHLNDCIETPGSNLKALNVQTLGSVDVPLVVNLPKPAAPRLRLRYERTLFARETVQKIGAHFETLLAGLIANPEQPVLNLPFLTTAEVDQLSIWNQTATAYPRERCIHQLFEEQAEARAAEIAVVFDDQQLSYAELNERANQLAHYLRRLGVQPETRIALCVERSLEMLVGMLGILKAGGAFAPLDSSHPLERISFMLEDLQAPVVLTQEHLLDKLPAYWGQVISLDADWDDLISLESTQNPINEATAENLAYVMYTSGSTGIPKGVSVAHRAVVRLVKNTDYVRLGPDEVFLQFAPISFDASTLEIWGCLLNGGRLAVMPPALPSLDTLGETLRKHGVTALWLTAGLFHLMVDERLDDLQPVRQLLAGGDALSPSHVKKAFQGLPSCRLINGYGPTEGTTFTCCYPVHDLDQLRTSVPIGRPIANTQAFILDRHLRPVPAGVTGELYIGGDGLARDYLNRPDLTAERFVPSTQGDVPGARLYQTGDLVRYLPDGNIEFLGRRDLQVKIRGFRIELGEVETALSAHPALLDAVVVARADIGGEKQLVAYLISREGNTVSIDELKDFLRRKLPEHMVPASFVWLDAFPLTANGKVDRRALPAPDGDRHGLAQDFVAPRTEIEQLLAVIWSQALGVDQVGIDDNFFSLGGDSIRSVQVLAKAQERGLAFSLQDLFQYQTIRELAAVARNSSQIDLLEPTLPFELITDEDRQKLPADVEDAYPLTMLQAGMIYHSELAPETAVYHDLFSHHVRAPYNPDAIRTALEHLARQHAALRTCFVLQDFSEPLQLVRRTAEIPVHIADLRDLSHAEQEEFLRDHLGRKWTRTFDWTKAPLLSIELHRRTSDSFQFTLSFHHAILDGWSMASMLAELFQTYFSIIEQQRSPASAGQLSGSYRDYVAMERHALRSGECRQYWKQKLAGGNGSLKYWQPRQREEENSGQVHKVLLEIPVELVTGLKRLASSVSVPIKSVLLAAHLKVLSVLSGQTDVTTGLVANGRPEEGDGERLLGLFLNTIPIRQQIRPGSWNELVQETFQNEWDALPYRWYPLGQMQLDQGGVELFETAFNFTHFHVARALQDRSRVELLGSISFERTNLPFFANFSLGLNSSEILFSVDANAIRFSRKQTEAIAGFYLRALEAMVADPESNHAWTSLLPHEQREEVLVTWNETGRDYAIDRCVHELFEAQAARTPQSVAVVFENERLTYAELNSKANQVAAWLQEKGVRPETRIALCLDRSLEMIVALFGILKAGAAYVPLDRGYPRERLAFMLRDAQVEFVLAQQRWAESLPHDGLPVIWLDREWDEINKHSADKVSASPASQNLAYILYTSGSTGQPKGVMISHSALVNYVQWVIEEFQLTPSDRVLQFASLTFDVAAEEIFSSLTSGATLVLRTEAMTSSVSTFLQSCAGFGITVLDVPTAFWHFMIGEMIADDLEIPDTVRLAVVGGEKALPERLSQWQARVGNLVGLKNCYGPTEATIASTMSDLNGPIIAHGVSELSIGRPVANTRIYILDRNLHPVPPGTAGELCIGGSGLARGYWNQPALTAERFIPDHLSDEQGQRLYRTGDRARHRPDGEIEFVDRMDQQVKVRGFRIELGEIETRLLEHPYVREAVVTTQQQEIDDARLIAYVVADEDPAVRPESLRQYLQEKLPEHMVPAAFVLLPALPLSPSGKVDRRALPAAETLSLAVSEPVTPRNEIEHLLHSIWSEVLKTDRFGIHDNFFALGGHSLLATQVITRLRKVFDLQAPLRQLFAHATIAELAHWVEQALRDESVQSPPLQKASRARPLPLSFAQQRLWFIDQLQPGSTVYNMPLALRLHGALDVAVLERVLTEIVRRHEVLRTRFESIDGEPVQVIAAAEPQQLDVRDVSALSAAEQMQIAREVVTAETQTPFDLAHGPLLRVRLLRLAAQEHVAVLVMHHVISDGWSMDVLLREVSTLYGAFSRGEASPLPELEIQYADYAVWQRDWLQDDELERQMSYWRRQLQSAPAVLELPQDYARPPVQTHNGATHTFVLEAELSSRVRELGHAAGTTIFMVLLASWQVLLKRLSGVDDICIGTVVAGRTHPQVEPLIGFFVNTLVLRVDMSGDPAFAELLQRVREVCLDAYSHQDVPFEKLVEELAPERSMAHAPLFQVMMVTQQQQAQDEAAPVDAFTIGEMEAESTSAKFDLTMYLRESRDVIMGALEYNTDIFASERVAAMVQQWERLLAAAVAQPERRISELPLLSDEEQQRLIARLNDGVVEYSVRGTLCGLFEEQAARTPAAIAAVCDGEKLTYAELNQRANQLGHHLQELGVGPEALVGVCVERSLEMVVALLGVLKAGGAYVPLDPAYPQERLAFMVTDAQLRVIVAQEKVVASLPAHEAAVVCVDADWERIAQAASHNVKNETTAENTAYVIYTSGSTGQPKGVAITQRNVLRLFQGTESYYHFGAADVWTMFHSYAFDFSVWELWGALLYGGKLVVVPYWVSRNPEAFYELLAAEGVTVLNQTPSAFRQLIEVDGAAGAALQLRLVIFGGEALEVNALRPWFERHGETEPQLVNMYGITETTVHVTYRALTATEEQSVIGRGLPDLQVYVLDEQM
ncbi:MAG TPA: amino acid adenylation domain-containing protein, partial [Pyrinomonadaceae bacterium]|nr:amino acid adenylation domain-containing protein [Pyrinomonadaceae bacterium]